MESKDIVRYTRRLQNKTSRYGEFQRAITYSECEKIIRYYQWIGILELNPVVLCYIS